MPLPPAHLLDELATAYVQIVAAAAGAIISVSRLDYGVDGSLNPVSQGEHGRYAETGFPIDFQLKGTTAASIEQNQITYDLNARNYNLVVTRERDATPFYLFLVCFDANSSDWITESPDRLTLKASAYWWTKLGPPTGNVRSIRIRIPAANRLTSTAIGHILQVSRGKFVP
jgi:hypothetical protein